MFQFCIGDRMVFGVKGEASPARCTERASPILINRRLPTVVICESTDDRHFFPVEFGVETHWNKIEGYTCLLYRRRPLDTRYCRLVNIAKNALK